MATRCKHGLPEASCGACARVPLDAPSLYGSTRAPAKEEARFHEEMIEIFRKTGEEFGYWPHYYLRLVRRAGGVAAAKKLLRDREVSDGFLRLVRERRLDLSVEHLVLRRRFASLFSEEERAVATDRLRTYGFDLPNR